MARESIEKRLRLHTMLTDEQLDAVCDSKVFHELVDGYRSAYSGMRLAKGLGKKSPVPIEVTESRANVAARKLGDLLAWSEMTNGME